MEKTDTSSKETDFISNEDPLPNYYLIPKEELSIINKYDSKAALSRLNEFETHYESEKENLLFLFNPNTN